MTTINTFASRVSSSKTKVVASGPSAKLNFQPLHKMAGPLADAMHQAFAATCQYVQQNNEGIVARACNRTRPLLLELFTTLRTLLVSAGVDMSGIDAYRELDYGHQDMYGGTYFEGRVNDGNFMLDFYFSTQGVPPSTLHLSFQFGRVKVLCDFTGTPEKLDKARLKQFFAKSFQILEKNGVAGKKTTIKL